MRTGGQCKENTLEELKFFVKIKEVRGMGFRDIRNFNLAMLAKQGWWYCKMRIRWFTNVSKPNTFPSVAFWKQKMYQIVHMCEKAYLQFNLY